MPARYASGAPCRHPDSARRTAVAPPATHLPPSVPQPVLPDLVQEGPVGELEELGRACAVAAGALQRGGDETTLQRRGLPLDRQIELVAYRSGGARRLEGGRHDRKSVV